MILFQKRYYDWVISRKSEEFWIDKPVIPVIERQNWSGSEINRRMWQMFGNDWVSNKPLCSGMVIFIINLKVPSSIRDEYNLFMNWKILTQLATKHQITEYIWFTDWKNELIIKKRSRLFKNDIARKCSRMTLLKMRQNYIFRNSKKKFF